MSRNPGTTIEDVVEALRQLGGEADAGEIKDSVAVIHGTMPASYMNDYSYRNSIQALINAHCPTSNGVQHREPRFLKIRHGRYRLI